MLCYTVYVSRVRLIYGGSWIDAGGLELPVASFRVLLDYDVMIFEICELEMPQVPQSYAAPELNVNEVSCRWRKMPLHTKYLYNLGNAWASGEGGVIIRRRCEQYREESK